MKKSKQYINGKTVAAIAFFVIIFLLSFFTAANNFGIIASSVKTGSLSQLKAGIEDVYSESLFFKDGFLNLWSLAQKVSIAPTRKKGALFEDAGYGALIMDTNGFLHFPAACLEVTPCVDAATEFARKLEKKGVPFLYVQAPNKKLKGYTVFPAGGKNVSNEDADEFLKGLKARNVDYFDLRERIAEENLERGALFYKGDHHWTTPTAFWAFCEVVGALRENYGLEIDESGYHRDIANYKVTTFKKYYLGSQGRRVGKFISGLDDYTFIEPDFETGYEIYNALKSKTQPMASGTFYESIVNEEILTSEDKSANRHAAYFEWDYGHLIIKNNITDSGINILLIKESFSLPFAAFLSTCVKELHIIDLRDADGPSPYDYIDEYDFDAVVMLYNTEVFAPPMFDLNR